MQPQLHQFGGRVRLQLPAKLVADSHGWAHVPALHRNFNLEWRLVRQLWSQPAVGYESHRVCMPRWV